MKVIIHQFMNALLISLLISVSAKAQSTDNEAKSAMEAKPFEIATYMGANRTINLMVAVHHAKGVTMKLRNADEIILYELYLKRSPKAYHHKLNFEECQPGVYQLEISDGRQTVVRRIDVVNMPAVDSQRYVTYSSLTN